MKVKAKYKKLVVKQMSSLKMRRRRIMKSPEEESEIRRSSRIIRKPTLFTYDAVGAKQ